MKAVRQSFGALAVVAALSLAGCGGDGDKPSDAESGQMAEVPGRDFDSTAELGTFLAESIDDVDVYRESESNPDFSGDRDADRLHVDFPSDGQPNTDRKASADAVQAAGSAAFDYDVLMISAETDTGTWSYIYSSKTVKNLTKDGTPIAADTVWDSADQDFDTIHR